jgi:hypothetical protein
VDEVTEVAESWVNLALQSRTFTYIRFEGRGFEYPRGNELLKWFMDRMLTTS